MNINSIPQIVAKVGMFGLTIFLLLTAIAIFFLIKNYGFGSDPVARSEKKQYKYGKKKFFMTSPENNFYHGLVQVVGSEYVVFAQVHLSTIVEVSEQGARSRGARSSVDRRSVDFVLCDKEYLSPKLAIELDDSSHERSDRRERDSFVEDVLMQARLPLLRIKNNENLSIDELRQKIMEAILI